MAVRVVVIVNIEPGKEAGFEAAFAEVSRRMKGTPGHIRDELLREHAKQGSYIVLGEWESAAVFHAWHDNPEHSATTLPMRSYWLGRTERRIFDVAVRLEDDNRSSPLLGGVG